MAALTQNKIRIRLKAYDHSAIERPPRRSSRRPSAPAPRSPDPCRCPPRRTCYCVIRSPVQGQGLARALRDPHAQAADRHPPAHAEDGRLAPATRPPSGRRRHPDPARLMPMAALLGTKDRHDAALRQEDGRVERVTVIEAGPCPSPASAPHERDGYEAVQLAFGEIEGEAADQGRARPPQEGRRAGAPPPARVPRRGRRARGRRRA